MVVYLIQFFSKDDFKLVVDNMQYFGEGIYIVIVFYVVNYMFEVVRSGVKKVVLVIIDGQIDIRDEKNLIEVVKNVSDVSVEIFVIGVVKRNDFNFEMFYKEMNLIVIDLDSEYVY